MPFRCLVECLHGMAVGRNESVLEACEVVFVKEEMSQCLRLMKLFL